MMFVDGENLTIRAQRFAQEEGITLQKGPYYERDVMVWLPELNARRNMLYEEGSLEELQHLGIRSY